MTFCVVALTGLSNHYRQTDPNRALAINPLNTNAIADLLLLNITGDEPSENSAGDLHGVARDAIRYAPIDARARGLYGEVLVRQGETEYANSVFETALSLSNTEAMALQRTLRRAVEEGNSEAAIEKLDILFRRWPSQFSSFAPVLPFLLTMPQGYQNALAALGETPPWRGSFLGYLNRDPATVDFAYRLQLDLNSNAAETNPREIGGTVSALLRYKRYDLAYRLFLLTLNEDERLHYGYVFNGGFELEPSARPFDWNLRDRPGVSVSRRSGDPETADSSALDIRFLGKPVRQVGVQQSLFLPRGRYELSVELDASNLKIPRGLYIEVLCMEPRAIITRLDIPEGSYRSRILKSEFSMPDTDCFLSKFEMGTDLIAESFRYRYVGGLTIRNVAIRKIGS